MLGFMAAAEIKFTLCIKAGSFLAEHDEIFFHIVGSALVISWVVSLAPSYDPPIYCVFKFWFLRTQICLLRVA